MKRFAGILFSLLINCIILAQPLNSNAASSSTICDFVPGSASSDCKSCINGKKTWTALGCIDTTSTSGFTGSLFKLGFGMAGGIAFLLIVFGGFQIMTSTGNPEKLEAGKELISSAIAGLLMILFSVFLLRLIGVDILGLPEWK